MRLRLTTMLLVLVVGALAFLLGRSLGPSQPEQPSRVAPEGASAPPPLSAPGPAPVQESPRVARRGPLPEPYSTRLDRARLDLTGDGSPEVVELFVAAERDHRGRLMWDDGQRWMLVAHDGDGEEGYLLFDDYVQIGRLSFWAIETVEPPNALILEVATGAGIRVWKVRYDPAAEAFVEEESVSASGNVVHRTPDELE